MKITATNINELQIGQEVFHIDHVQMPERYKYIGRLLSDFGGNREDHVFAGHNSVIKIGVGIEDKSDYLRYESKLFTTYKEACEKLRVYLINHIDHWNKHQLKGMEIEISEQDQQSLWHKRKG